MWAFLECQQPGPTPLLAPHRPIGTSQTRNLMRYAGCMSFKTYMTMADAMRDLKRRGFTADFELIGKTFRTLGSERAFQPDELTIVEHHRFEGQSDPEEMAVVYAIEARDGTRGVLVDAYGVYANPDLSAFLKDVRML